MCITRRHCGRPRAFTLALTLPHSLRRGVCCVYPARHCMQLAACPACGGHANAREPLVAFMNVHASLPPCWPDQMRGQNVPTHFQPAVHHPRSPSGMTGRRASSAWHLAVLALVVGLDFVAAGAWRMCPRECCAHGRRRRQRELSAMSPACQEPDSLPERGGYIVAAHTPLIAATRMSDMCVFLKKSGDGQSSCACRLQRKREGSTCRARSLAPRAAERNTVQPSPSGWRSECLTGRCSCRHELAQQQYRSDSRKLAKGSYTSLSSQSCHFGERTQLHGLGAALQSARPRLLDNYDDGGGGIAGTVV